ncbi:MAG: hypothetical protein LWY06_16475, partial [Firmicutes bacterium]|nr:hypothetical protein [Bacillota bacterium]
AWIDNIRQRLINCTFHLGLAMKTSKEMKLQLKFKSLPYQRFLDEQYTKTDIEKLAHCLFEKKSIKIYEIISIDAFVEKLKEAAAGMQEKQWLICRGHDMTSVLALILSEKTGKNLNRSIVESNLRLAYEYEHFKETDLYKSIIRWEEKSGRYKIFR